MPSAAARTLNLKLVFVWCPWDMVHYGVMKSWFGGTVWCYRKLRLLCQLHLNDFGFVWRFACLESGYKDSDHEHKGFPGGIQILREGEIQFGSVPNVIPVPHPAWQHHWAISGSSEGSILKSSHEVSNPVLGKPPHGSGSTADRPRPSSCSPFYWRSTISWQHLPPRTTFLISNRTLRYRQSHRQRAKPPGAAEGAFDRCSLSHGSNPSFCNSYIKTTWEGYVQNTL